MPSTSEGFEFKDSENVNNSKFDIFPNKNKITIAGGLLGLIIIGIGAFLYKQGLFQPQNKVEIINASAESTEFKKEIVVDISGAVVKPGVYKLDDGARMQDLLIAAGGLSVNADREWVAKYINLAAKLTDAQKIFVQGVGEQSGPTSAKLPSRESDGTLGVSTTVGGMVNINSATLTELDKLPGIGQVYGQNIIEHRPYSSVEDLMSKGVLKKSVYEKIKDKVVVY